MASKRKPEPSDAAPTRSNLQLPVQEIARSAIKGADYNPRVIQDSERDRLRAILKKHGLVCTLTWNRRTGNLVGGHQRLAIMDVLEGKPDYLISVSVGDWDAKQEREINVALNNTSAMGDWDLEKLSALYREDKIGVAESGFDMAEIYRMFGASPLVEREDDGLQEVAQRINEARERYNEISQKSRDRDGADFYWVVVFASAEERDKAAAALGLDENRFQDGRGLVMKLAQERKGA